MKTQHTPGKWEAVERGNTFHTWVVKCGRKLIANVAAPNSEEHAQLIAAAPEFAQGCVDLVGILHAINARCPFGVPFTPQNNPCFCTHHQQYHAARAAITKATK